MKIHMDGWKAQLTRVIVLREVATVAAGNMFLDRATLVAVPDILY